MSDLDELLEKLRGGGFLHRQAAEEIASLRADRDKWHRVAMDAGAVTCADGGHIFPRRDEIASIRAQLASGKAYDDLREQHIAKLEAQLASARKAAIEECMETIGNLRQSEAGLFDAAHSGQRGEDRSTALYDAYHLLRKLALTDEKG